MGNSSGRSLRWPPSRQKLSCSLHLSPSAPAYPRRTRGEGNRHPRYPAGPTASPGASARHERQKANTMIAAFTAVACVTVLERRLSRGGVRFGGRALFRGRNHLANLLKQFLDIAVVRPVGEALEQAGEGDEIGVVPLAERVGEYVPFADPDCFDEAVTLAASVRGRCGGRPTARRRGGRSRGRPLRRPLGWRAMDRCRAARRSGQRSPLRHCCLPS